MAKNIRIIPNSGSVYFIGDVGTEANAIQFALNNTSNNVKIYDGQTGQVFLFFDKTNLRTEFSSSVNLFATSSNPPASVGGVYYNTTDGNIYRSNGSAWFPAAGSSGTSGAKGNTGASGSSGTSGNSGSSGTSGTNGTSGSSGTSGTSGSSGTSGTSGSSGTSGAKGQKGEVGASGSSGTSGAKGQKGEIGASGSSGTSGAKGQKGESGAKGNTGAKGNSGSSAGINSYTNPGDNRVITSVDSSTINAEANLTFSNNELQIGDGSATNANLTLYASNYGSGYAGRIQGRNSDGRMYFQHRDNSATYNDIGYVNQSGITAIAFYQSSDIKFKNILETNPDITLELDVIKYTRTDSNLDQIRYGYSAQQVQEILPDLVNDGEKLTVNYTDIHTLKIAALEKRITELENRIKVLESK